MATNTPSRPTTQQPPPPPPPPPQQQQQQPELGEEELRRDILESAIIGQEQARSAQQELIRQGRQLRRSLGDSQQVALQTRSTGRAVEQLIREKRSSTARTVLTCCLERCLPCCASAAAATAASSPRSRRHDDHDQQQQHQVQLSPGSEHTVEEDDTEAETMVRIDRLRRILDESRRQDRDKKGGGGGHQMGWRATLEPLPGASSYNTAVETDARQPADIWYRQVDACLSQLQQIADEMGDSLDEQIKLAQILTIYLNYGVDQAMRANEKLLLAEEDKRR